MLCMAQWTVFLVKPFEFNSTGNAVLLVDKPLVQHLVVSLEATGSLFCGLRVARCGSQNMDKSDLVIFWERINKKCFCCSFLDAAYL